MPEVEITALGPVRKFLGYNHRIIDFEGETVEDLLKQIDTEENGTLHDFMVNSEGELETDLVLFLNEKELGSDELNRSLEPGDKVVTMDVVRPIRGG